MAQTMTAKEAVAVLRVNAATLYSYVSRGLIHSEPSPDDTRERRYDAEDVRRLVERKAQRRDPARAAKKALRWGAPVLESALTLITESGLYYRGEDALKLAQERSLEAVAALMWTGDLGKAESLFSQVDQEAKSDLFRPPTAAQMMATQWGNLSFIQRMQITLAAEADAAAYDLRPESVARTGARILWLNAQAIAPQIQFGEGIARGLAQQWRVGRPELINAAMVLCADHELNTSSFTARVVASAEANPYAAVSGGLAALQGFKHGGNTLRVRAFLREVESMGDARAAIHERLQRGEPLPGFGHVLYPQGDPRAKLLLTLVAKAYRLHSMTGIAQFITDEVERLTGELPNVDFAMVVLEQTMGLPQDSALALFALGRTVGWIGHAMEQYSSEVLIRPRAAYVGVLPTRE